MSRITVGCELHYRVTALTSFLFNVAVAHTAHQTVRQETFTVNPPYEAVGLMPPDFHGFFEAYLGSRWYLFDATRMAPKNGFVRIGAGRDAADASFASVIGAADLERMTVSARELTDEIADDPASDSRAMSTA